MSGFLFETAPRIVCQDGAAARLSEHLPPRGAGPVLVVTDPGLVAAGVIGPVVEALKADGLDVRVWDAVEADPPEAVVERTVAFAREIESSLVIGLGGGSAMDTAKLVALLARSGERLQAVYGVGLARGPRLPLVQVPTTAGTGSEVTPIAIVTTPTDEKKGVVAPVLYPDVAVLDATLTLGLPPAVTAATGVDAMVHAIEAYTSRHKKNPVSDALALKALDLLWRGIRPAVADGRDLEARRAMLQGALLAGMAFANAPVAAVHALAYPLGGRFHVPHGLSNALVLAPVLRFNRPAAEGLYEELGRSLGLRGAGGLIHGVERLLAVLPMPRTLREVGVGEGDLDALAADAMNVQRLLVNNPREVTLTDARAIYAEVL